MSPEGDDESHRMTHELTGRPRELSFQKYRVVVTAGAQKDSEAVSTGQELVVGSAAGVQLVLADPTVSRHHFSISVTPKGFLLRDLESTNGTTLGGFHVLAAYLAPGAIIGAGRTTLKFELLDGKIREPLSAESRWGRLLGTSSAMRRIFAVMPRVAASDSTVLLEGETGTGKGLLAEAIHQAGPRCKQPLVVVDCGAIPPTLIESELFGHERGSFTGATGTHIGAFEAAQGGTVFLDEIGELPLDMQPKLLRVLEERKIKRVGGTQSISLDVRVVAATNRNLHQEVNRGTFRSDLFYRLDIVRLHIPPLRERRDDLALLIAHFYEQFAPGGGPPPEELLERLGARDYPGNVRELRSAVERAVLLRDPTLWDQATPSPSQKRDASAGAPSEAFDPTASFRAAKERAVSTWETGYIGELVRRNGGNLSAAARAARMDRNYLRELMRRHHLQISDD